MLEEGSEGSGEKHQAWSKGVSLFLSISPFLLC